MMFKDKYKAIVDEVKPNENEMNNLRARMLKQVDDKNNIYSKKLQLYPKVIVAMSLLIILMLTSFTTILLNQNNSPFVIDNNSKITLEKSLTYSDIYAKLLAASSRGYFNNNGGVVDDRTDWEVEVPTSQEGDNKDTGNANNETPDYSDTNIQVEGVQEADIVKTDGTYIYAVFNSSVYIYSVDNGVLTKIAIIESENGDYFPDTKGIPTYTEGNAGTTDVVTPDDIIIGEEGKEIVSDPAEESNTDHGKTMVEPEY